MNTRRDQIGCLEKDQQTEQTERNKQRARNGKDHVRKKSAENHL